jgi:hypothetical protein
MDFILCLAVGGVVGVFGAVIFVLMERKRGQALDSAEKSDSGVSETAAETTGHKPA